MTMRLELEAMRIPIPFFVVIPCQDSDIFWPWVIRVLADPVFGLRMPVVIMDWRDSRNKIMH